MRVPLSTLAGEFSVPLSRARELVGALLAVEAVHASDEGLVVVGWQPSAAEGLRLAGFLANVAAVIDDQRAAAKPRATSDRRLRPVTVQEADVGARRRRAREPLAAAIITVAAAVLAALAPSSGPLTALRTVTSSPVVPVLSDHGAGVEQPEAAPAPLPRPSSPVSVAPTPLDASDPVLGDLPGEAAPPQASPAVVPTTANPRASLAAGSPTAPTPGAAPAPSGDPRRAPAAPVPVPSRTPSRSSAPTAPGPAPSPGSRPGSQPPPAPGGPVTNDPATLVPVVCPVVKAPFALVESALVRPGAFDALAGLDAPPVMEVTGTLVNPSTAAVVVGLFEVEVDVGGGQVAVSASPTPRPVPAGGTATWRMLVTVPADSNEGDAGVADARVVRWSWLDDEVSKACPT